jgi:hypothetical protein
VLGGADSLHFGIIWLRPYAFMASHVSIYLAESGACRTDGWLDAWVDTQPGKQAECPTTTTTHTGSGVAQRAREAHETGCM